MIPLNWQKPFLLVVIFALPFLVYSRGNFRFGVGGALLGDHVALMSLRHQSDSELEFAWKAANFDRYRGQSQVFLFRPGLGIFHAIVDYFWRSNFYISGFLSVFFHALFCCMAFLIISHLTRPLIAALIAATLACHFCGSEMIAWRHISPYIFSFGLVLLGAFTFKKHTNFAVFLFVTATLFHEIASATFICLFVLNLFPKFRKWFAEKSQVKGKQLLISFGIVAAISILLTLITFIVSMTQLHGGTFADAKLIDSRTFGGYLVDWLYGIAMFWNLSAGDYFIPQMMSASIPERQYSSFAFGILGIATLWFGFDTVRKKTTPKFFIVFVISFVFLTMLLVGFCTMRIIPHGVDIIGKSHYYRYFSNFVLAVSVAALLERGSKQLISSKIVFVCFLMMAGNQIYYGAAKMFRLGKLSDHQETTIAKNLQAADRYLGNVNRCFQASPSDTTQDILPEILLWRSGCEYKKMEPNLYGLSGNELLSQKIIFRSE